MDGFWGQSEVEMAGECFDAELYFGELEFVLDRNRNIKDDRT